MKVLVFFYIYPEKYFGKNLKPQSGCSKKHFFFVSRVSFRADIFGYRGINC